MKKSPQFHGAINLTQTHRGPLPLHQIDGPDHLEAELHTTLGVVDARRRQTRHAVIAVAQELDPQAVALLENRKTFIVEADLQGPWMSNFILLEDAHKTSRMLV